MTTEGRVRWSCGSALRQTSQWHPIIGTPALVPVPRNKSSTSSEGIARGYTRERFGKAREAPRDAGLLADGPDRFRRRAVPGHHVARLLLRQGFQLDVRQ